MKAKQFKKTGNTEARLSRRPLDFMESKEALSVFVGNRGTRQFISREQVYSHPMEGQGNKGLIWWGTKTILGNMEHTILYKHFPLLVTINFKGPSTPTPGRVFCISVFRPSGHIFPQVRSSYHGIFYTGIFTLGMSSVLLYSIQFFDK